jgi:predicted acyl esterase
MTGGSSTTEPTPRPRTRRRRALDAAVARVFRMPPGHRDFTLTSAVRVPMRDGVELLTDVYLPIGKSLGTVLMRTPYGRNTTIAILTARYYATHGFHVVNQSCRGTSAPVGVSSRSVLISTTEPTPSSGSAGNRGSTGDSRCVARPIWGIPLGP